MGSNRRGQHRRESSKELVNKGEGEQLGVAQQGKRVVQEREKEGARTARVLVRETIKAQGQERHK